METDTGVNYSAINVPYICYEGTSARLERTNRRYFIAILTLIVMLATTNAMWITYEINRCKAMHDTVTQDIDIGAITQNHEAVDIGDIGEQ